MAGVCGIVSCSLARPMARFEGDESARKQEMLARLAPMLASARHLGPDGTAIHAEPGLGLVQFLDHQTPESVLVTGPVRDLALDLTLVADVRLDNREQLAEQLGIEQRELSSTA